MNVRRVGAVLGLAMAAISGCSAGASSGAAGTDREDPSDPASQETGSVGLSLMLPSGESIEVLSWSITGPNNASTVVQSGTVNSQSLGVTFLVGSIPPATGYRIALSGTATDGSVTCTGSAGFDVTARVTTPVSLNLACSVATAGAHVTRVNGSSYDCAAWSNVSASPTETTVGGSVSVSASASGPVQSALTYAWSATSGTFGNPAAAMTTFTCSAVGSVAVTLTVGDGPVPAGDSCSAALSSKTIDVMCDSPVVPPVPAMPPWGLFAMVTALMGIGAYSTKRR